ncbi:unnamed protein product [Rangifer tarandus platyrhynchus]|uniref:Uncharacterized protein n=2 Tax=Rangifer tarandus platyrhynchus TaxID=3082113 RepID=A0ACB0ELY5_RANTA|nr:unnamed protein product [Rangifer tarandus platyrhynchus]CAI9701563.1 unnamed protein product [Rangifer tarandus platyrhynchus]
MTAPGFTIWSSASVVGAEVLKIRICVCSLSKNHQPRVLYTSFAKCGPQDTCSPMCESSRNMLISWSPTLEPEYLGVWFRSLHFPAALQVAPAFGAQNFETSGAPPRRGGARPSAALSACANPDRKHATRRPRTAKSRVRSRTAGTRRRLLARSLAQRSARMRARAPRLSSRRAFRCPGYR